MSEGSATAALLTVILSAPASRSRPASSTEAMPPADGEGDVDACGDARHQSGEGAATFGRGADVEVDQLVGTFGGVAGAQLHRIAHTAQVGEIDAL